jgi:hypothetical protein
MSFDWIKNSLLDQWQMIAGAPAIFIMATLIVGAAIWAVLRWAYGSMLQNKDALVALQVAQLNDYKDKLSGASPDQAKARIDALETQIKQLAPRSLEEVQTSSLVAAVARVGAHSIDVMCDMACSDGKKFAGQLGHAFKNAGWEVRYPMLGGTENPPYSGLGLRVRDVANLNSFESAVAQGLRVAGLQFDIQKRLHNPMHPGPEVELLISSRLT